MSDFQCPFCRTFALTTFPEIDSLYIATGKVRWAFVNFPLTSVHDNALAAAEVALCAAQQNAFWRVHDLLYQHQDVWAPLKQPEAFFLTLADSAKISRPALLACVQSPATRETLRQEAEGAQRSGATARRVLHRGRPAHRRAADADLPAGAGLDHPGEDAEGAQAARSPHPEPASDRNTSYSAWVHAVIPKPRSRYRPLNSTPAIARKANELSSSRSPYGPM